MNGGSVFQVASRPSHPFVSFVVPQRSLTYVPRRRGWGARLRMGERVAMKTGAVGVGSWIVMAPAFDVKSLLQPKLRPRHPSIDSLPSRSPNEV